MNGVRDYRLLWSTISSSKKIRSVRGEYVEGDIWWKIACHLLYTWMIAWQDDERRLNGEPLWILANVVPHEGLTVEQISRMLNELHRVNLIIWYEVNGERFIQIVENNGKDYQKIREDRIKKSIYPPPPKEYLMISNICQNAANCGNSPQFDDNSPQFAAESPQSKYFNNNNNLDDCNDNTDENFELEKKEKKEKRKKERKQERNKEKRKEAKEKRNKERIKERKKEIKKEKIERERKEEKYKKEEKKENFDVSNELIDTSITNTPTTKGKQKKLVFGGKPTSTIDERFQRFWQAYPKKRNKGQAERIWYKIKPNEKLLEVMLEAIDRAKESYDWQKENGQFIPYPATWLNGKGWEDEYKPVPEFSSQPGLDAWLKKKLEEEPED